MVSEKCHRLVGALKVVSPVIESMDHCEQLVIVDVIVSFSRREHLGEVSTRVKIAIVILLHENSATS